MHATTSPIPGDNAFRPHREPKCATLREESKLEKIGKCCFAESGLEKIVIPKTLKTIDADAFMDCESLKTILLEDGCTVSLSHTEIPASANVVPQLEMTAWGIPLLELRNLKKVVIPEGTERI